MNIQTLQVEYKSLIVTVWLAVLESQLHCIIVSKSPRGGDLSLCRFLLSYLLCRVLERGCSALNDSEGQFAKRILPLSIVSCRCLCSFDYKMVMVTSREVLQLYTYINR